MESIILLCAFLIALIVFSGCPQPSLECGQVSSFEEELECGMMPSQQLYPLGGSSDIVMPPQYFVCMQYATCDVVGGECKKVIDGPYDECFEYCIANTYEECIQMYGSKEQ
ncbi:MAG: hypothetical protein JW772_05465 [Candidatus Diapherotrites archaeon]|nr:hypothetical protein [Candidatus Diapherotrites archaeon]